MIYITQLIYINQGEEETFHAFERLVIPIIEKYHGELMLRMRPDVSSIIASAIEQPYEIHLVKFDSEQDFDGFLNDEERASYLDMKEQSIRSTLLIKGGPL